jgi:ribonuclease D
MIVASPIEVADLERSMGTSMRVGMDLEASGMFAYRARPCTMQFAWGNGENIAVVDVLSVSIQTLAAIVGKSGPLKIVHDIAFDARLLAESGLELGHVHDTALAARMLGRTSTGLATLLESILGLKLSKEMQHHDWRRRPLDATALAYLASDVASLERLDDALWSEVVERGIEQEVAEETEYRLQSAIAAARAPQSGPAYLRMKGVDRLAMKELAVLREIAELREQEAERRDVPPYRVMSNDTLVEIARRRPATAEELGRMRGTPMSSAAGRAFVAEVARAVAAAGTAVPEEEQARLQRPRVPSAVHRARREREGRLLAWRRAEAARRGVDEQVVLPGHCVRDTVDGDTVGVEQLARVRGIGAFRVERNGEAILRALRGEEMAP